MDDHKISLDFLRMLTDNLKELAAILDPNGTVLYINRTALKLISETENNIVGKLFWDTPWWSYSTKDRQSLIDTYHKALQGTSAHFEASYLDKKGKWVFTDFTMTPVMDADGKVIYLIPEGRNITELKMAQSAAESSEAKYRKLFTTSTDAMLIIDDYKFVDFNRAALQMFGFEDASQLTNLHPGALSPQFQSDDLPSSSKSIQMMDIAYNTGTHRFEWLHQKCSGEVFPTEVLLTAIPENDKQILFAVVRDITSQKRHEADIYELNRNLELKVLERTKELENSLENLKNTQDLMIEQEKMATLGTLVAGITHDLNTPLGNAVMASTYLLNEFQQMKTMFESGAINKTKFEHFLQDGLTSATSVVKSLEHATHQITSFKNIAVDQSNESMRKINIKSYLDEIVSTFHAKLKKSHHEINLYGDDHLMITCYPGSLAQIVSNLISNSLVHGFKDQREGRISIQFEIHDGCLHLKYEDNGCGVDPELSKHVFEPFITTRREHGSSGLGLHIVSTLVQQKLGGQISLESQKDAYTRFYIDLPLLN